MGWSGVQPGKPDAVVYRHGLLWTSRTWRNLLTFLLVTSMTVAVTTGEATCKWTRLKDTSTDISRAASTKSVTSVARCRQYCTSDVACVAFAYGNRTCYTFHQVLPPRLQHQRWYYYSRECTEAQATTPASPAAVDSETQSCSWTEMRNSAADEREAADRYYFLSLFQCWAYCETESRCVVATFKSPVCRIYHETVPPVHSVGTTYLAKSCKDAEMTNTSPSVISAPTSTSLSDESTLRTSVTLATSSLITASVVKEEPEVLEKPSCTWIRVDDSSAGDQSAADVKYLLSLEDCQQYCDEYPGCLVVVYKSLTCRIFENGVQPVDDVDSTFLRKSCTEAKPDTKTGEVGAGAVSEPENETTSEPATQPPTEIQTESPLEPGTQPPTEIQTESPLEPGTQPPTEIQTESPLEPGTQPPTEIQTESPLEPGTQPPTEPENETTTEPKTDNSEPGGETARLSAESDETSTAFISSTTPFCTWTEVQERSAKQVREVDTDAVSSLEECQQSCDQDSNCEAVLFNPPLCRKVFGATPVAQPGWTYLQKSCITTDTASRTSGPSTSSSDNNEVEATAETLPPSLTSSTENTWTITTPATATPSCTWIEVPDTSVAEGPPTDTASFFSLEECAEYCDALPACVVAVFNTPECRVYDYDVTPVDDVGWAYLQKSCTAADEVTAEPPASTGTSVSVTPDEDPTDNVAETSALSDSSTPVPPATAAPCTWEELADTSAEDSVLVETLYASSLHQCKALCETDRTCTVVIFSSSMCRKFHDVTPVADAGWTYLRKSCLPDRISRGR